MANGMLDALRNGQQCDEDGVMCIVSRQACHEAADEIERLRACLEHTREEICEGPVDDVLWHSAIPSCTTVDNITLALNDGWTYDGWLQAKADQA